MAVGRVNISSSGGGKYVLFPSIYKVKDSPQSGGIGGLIPIQSLVPRDSVVAYAGSIALIWEQGKINEHRSDSCVIGYFNNDYAAPNVLYSKRARGMYTLNGFSNAISPIFTGQTGTIVIVVDETVTYTNTPANNVTRYYIVIIKNGVAREVLSNYETYQKYYTFKYKLINDEYLVFLDASYIELVSIGVNSLTQVWRSSTSATSPEINSLKTIREFFTDKNGDIYVLGTDTLNNLVYSKFNIDSEGITNVFVNTTDYGITNITGHLFSKEDGSILIVYRDRIVKLNNDGTVQWDRAFSYVLSSLAFVTFGETEIGVKDNANKTVSFYSYGGNFIRTIDNYADNPSYFHESNKELFSNNGKYAAGILKNS